MYHRSNAYAAFAFKTRQYKLGIMKLVKNKLNMVFGLES